MSCAVGSGRGLSGTGEHSSSTHTMIKTDYISHHSRRLKLLCLQLVGGTLLLPDVANAITLLKSIWIQSGYPKEWMGTDSMNIV